ncbi:MAG: hypothetical protein ACOYL3_12905 [Desulfuromonadaceae bacterium]
MNRILNTSTAALVMISFATSVFAAEVITPAPPAQAAKPSVAETNAKHRQREIDARAAKAAAANKAAEPATPSDEAIEAAHAAKLEKRNKAAKSNKKSQKKPAAAAATDAASIPVPAAK